jgi:transcriptional regulator with XRE-family HTH domain
MTALARWLKRELELHGLTQQVAAVHAGVSVATLSDMLRRGHVPRLETLLRLADYFETPREEVLRLAARIPLDAEEAGKVAAGSQVAERDPRVQELVEEFGRLPEEWQEVVLEQVMTYARLVNLPGYRIIGGEEEAVGGAEAGSREEGEDAAQAA